MCLGLEMSLISRYERFPEPCENISIYSTFNVTSAVNNSIKIHYLGSRNKELRYCGCISVQFSHVHLLRPSAVSFQSIETISWLKVSAQREFPRPAKTIIKRRESAPIADREHRTKIDSAEIHL